MTGTEGQTESQLRPLVAAAAWRVHFAETGESTSPAFEAWLAADPENRAAWAAVDDSWSAFGEGESEFELLSAQRHARDTLLHSRVRHGRSIAPLLRIAATVTLIAGAAAGGMLYWQQRPLAYQTAYNQQDTITLADGSKIMLDSSTELRVRDRAHMRDLELVRGQARFQIVHNPARPLYVHAGSEKIIDIGTDFDVDRPGRAVVVTLIEGRVAVASEEAHSKPVELNPGEQLSVGPAHNTALVHVDVSRVTAWQNGELVFDNEPLSAIVQRINRYAAHPIVVADAKAGALRLSGVFRTGDTRGFLHMVSNYLPVTATYGENGQIRLTARN